MCGAATGGFECVSIRVVPYSTVIQYHTAIQYSTVIQSELPYPPSIFYLHRPRKVILRAGRDSSLCRDSSLSVPKIILRASLDSSLTKAWYIAALGDAPRVHSTQGRERNSAAVGGAWNIWLSASCSFSRVMRVAKGHSTLGAHLRDQA